MVIDIDKFLSEHDDSGEEKPEVKANENEKIDLDIEKDVDQKFKLLRERLGDKDFEMLFNAYQEIKQFDESLPSKLFGINSKSAVALGEIGNKYSDGFLSGVRSNMQRHSANIRSAIKEIDSMLSANNFQQAISVYNNALASYKVFPTNFMSEKIELGKELRTREIKINEKFDLYRIDEVKKTKQNIAKEVSKLKVNMLPGNIKSVEESIVNLNHILDRTPKVFFGELIKERIAATKIIVEAEEFLKKEYDREFEEKENLLHHLFEKFHRYKLNKDANNALAVYDEIVILFEKVPDVFLDKKVALYKEITKILESLNTLLLSNNINTFLETYNNSKILNETREYVLHAKKTGKADLQNMIGMRAKLKEIPMALKPEKMEVEMELEKMIEQLNAANKAATTAANKAPYFKEGDAKSPGAATDAVTKTQNKEVPKDNVSKHILAEINEHYENLKKATNKKDAEVLYKKIKFYIDTGNFKENTKKDVMARVNKVVKSKNLA